MGRRRALWSIPDRSGEMAISLENIPARMYVRMYTTRCKNGIACIMVRSNVISKQLHCYFYIKVEYNYYHEYAFNFPGP
jgi:hypothetical protein